MNAPLSFWERRRAAVKAEEETEIAAKIQVAEAVEREELEGKSDSEILEALNLPDPDNLNMGDDFSAFMTKTVPTHIRNRALRKLWRSNPVLACLDGLNDYDDDYLTGSIGAGPIKTTYQVGKGMLFHLQEMERQRIAAEAAKTAADDIATDCLEPAPDKDPIDPLANTRSAKAYAGAEQYDAETAQNADTDTAPTPRRMKFRFEEPNA